MLPEALESARRTAVIVTIQGKESNGVHSFKDNASFRLASTTKDRLSPHYGVFATSASGVLLVGRRIATSGHLFRPFIDIHALSMTSLRSDTTIYVTLYGGTTYHAVLTAFDAVESDSLPREAMSRILASSSQWLLGHHYRSPAQLSQHSSHGEIAILTLREEVEIEGDIVTTMSSSLSSPLPTPPVWGSPFAVHRAQDITVIGSPYGILDPTLFANHVYNGIVSNLMYIETPQQQQQQQQDIQHRMAAPRKPALYILDVPCVPGLEGAPIFSPQGILLGIIGPHLTRVDGLPVHLSLGIPIDCILSTLIALDKRDRAPSDALIPGTPLPRPSSKVPRAVQQALEACVLIRIGPTWASGVLISQHGHILTNAHVVSPYLVEPPRVSARNGAMRTGEPESYQVQAGMTIEVRQDHWSDTKHSMHSSQWKRANVIVVFDGTFDVALLQCTESMPGSHPTQPVTMGSIRLGDPVHVIGHGVFGPECQLGPSITLGSVSSLYYVAEEGNSSDSGDIALLTTTARVHQGNSGGMVVNMDGQCVGLVTSNTKPSKGTGVITTLNYSIGSSALAIIQEHTSRCPRGADASQDSGQAVIQLRQAVRPIQTALEKLAFFASDDTTRVPARASRL